MSWHCDQRSSILNFKNEFVPFPHQWKTELSAHYQLDNEPSPIYVWVNKVGLGHKMIALEDNQPCQIVHRKLAHLHRLRREIRQLKSKASTIIAQERQERVDATSILPQEMPDTHSINYQLSAKLKTGQLHLTATLMYWPLFTHV